MGAAALDAAERFQTTAEQLSLLAVLQLVFYAGMQIPVGILLDRFGSKRLLIAGAAFMGVGQLFVAFAPSLQVAILGRILVGIGDACTFISMIRLVNVWYSGAKASKLQQWLGTFGQLGQVLSAIPFVYLLKVSGWALAFTSMALVAAVTAIALFAGVQDKLNEDGFKPSFKSVLATLRKNVRKPVTWVGFFTHFSTQSSGTMFALLWGVPFIVSGLGHDHAFASAALTFLVVTNASMGPVIGWFCARWPQYRARWVLTVVTLISLAWLSIIVYASQTPDWLLFLVLGVVGAGGPSSMIAFDFSKQSIPARELGSANGVINVGGFLAAFTMMYLVGISLDIQGGPELYSFEHFKVALATQLAVLAIGAAGFIISYRRLRNKSRTLAV